MITLTDILKSRHVTLDLCASDVPAALDELATALQGDSRIINWAVFHDVLRRGAAEGLTVLSCGAALCHARTEGVAGIIMAAGRLQFAIKDTAGSPEGPSFRYLFVIGLPPTMASDYLRMVGALARSLKDEATLHLIDQTNSAEEFVEILSKRELTP